MNSKTLKALLMLAGICLASVASVMAEVHVNDIEYSDGDTKLKGYVAYDDNFEGQRPGVLICHQWMGLTDYEERRARELAKLGYVAFALDVYGAGVRPESREEAGKLSSKYKGDRDLMRSRLMAGLEKLQEHRAVDPKKIAVIGYCFGGTCALEVARAGADVAGVVSFHGGLSAQDKAEPDTVKAKVLVCHGAEDPYVPEGEVLGFIEEMTEAGVDFQFIAYADAVHSFTQKHSGDDKSTGAAYNKKADFRSWQHMKLFFDEAFKQ